MMKKRNAAVPDPLIFPPPSGRSAKVEEWIDRHVKASAAMRKLNAEDRFEGALAFAERVAGRRLVRGREVMRDTRGREDITRAYWILHDVVTILRLGSVEQRIAALTEIYRKAESVRYRLQHDLREASDDAAERGAA